MLRRKPVILWYYVLLLLRKLEIQKFAQEVSIPFCVVADTSARGSTGIGSARGWCRVKSAKVMQIHRPLPFC